MEHNDKNAARVSLSDSGKSNLMESLGREEDHKIPIFCTGLDGKRLACEVGYGIEEEGLPYRIVMGEYDGSAVWETNRGSGLGVSVLVESAGIFVYCRQLKTMTPLFECANATLNHARILGNNAARIVKNKPFLEFGKR